MDVLPHVLGCLGGLALVVVGALVVQPRRLGLGGGLDDAAPMAYAHPLAVLVLVALHFGCTAAPLLWLALCSCCRGCCGLRAARQRELAKRFYDECAPRQPARQPAQPRRSASLLRGLPPCTL